MSHNVVWMHSEPTSRIKRNLLSFLRCQLRAGHSGAGIARKLPTWDSDINRVPAHLEVEGFETDCSGTSLILLQIHIQNIVWIHSTSTSRKTRNLFLILHCKQITRMGQCTCVHRGRKVSKLTVREPISFVLQVRVPRCRLNAFRANFQTNVTYSYSFWAPTQGWASWRWHCEQAASMGQWA